MEKSLSHTEIIDFLKSEKTFLSNEFGVVNIGLFGSFAKGEQTADSDIDILVEFEEGANLLHLVGLSLFLEEKLNVPVDIVPSDTLRKEIREDVLKEAIYL